MCKTSFPLSFVCDIGFLLLSALSLPHNRYLVVILIAVGAGQVLGVSALLGQRRDRKALVIRAVLYYGALNFYYWALMFIPIGMCTVLGYTFPLATAVISHAGCCGPRERLSAIGWTCSITAFAGILLVVAPWAPPAAVTAGNNTTASAAARNATNLSGGGGAKVAADLNDTRLNTLWGVLLTTASALCWAVQVIFIRKTRAGVHWLQVEMVTACVHSFLITPLVWLVQFVVLTIAGQPTGGGVIFDAEASAGEWGLCLAVGAAAFIGLGCSTRGFQLEEAPRGAIIMYLEIPFSTFVAVHSYRSLGVPFSPRPIPSSNHLRFPHPVSLFYT